MKAEKVENDPEKRQSGEENSKAFSYFYFLL
jgi:hypothetical protein